MEGMRRRNEFANDIVQLRKIGLKNDWSGPYEKSVSSSIIWENKVILVTDIHLRIVFATKNIFDMNGYRPEEVMGKNPRIFQGPLTEHEEKKRISIALANQLNFESTLSNYRKDGTIYKCHVQGYPLFTPKQKLVNLIAFERQVR